MVPYRSLFFLPALCASTLNWPLGPATLSLYKFALSWLTFSRSAKSFPDRLFYRPGILFPATCFLRPDLITALSFWLRFLDRLFRRPLFPTQPYPTGCLGGRIALFACVFTALLWGRLFGGSAIPPPSCLLPPSLRPLPGAASGAYSSVASPVARLLDPFSCRLVVRSRGVGLFSTASLFVIFLHIRGLRSSRHLGVGTRAPRVLPPPSWDLSAIGN